MLSAMIAPPSTFTAWAPDSFMIRTALCSARWLSPW